MSAQDNWRQCSLLVIWLEGTPWTAAVDLPFMCVGYNTCWTPTTGEFWPMVFWANCQFIVIHCLSHQCSSQMRPFLVVMASQISTTNISGHRRIHLERSVLDTSSKTGLMCGLVLWVILRCTCSAIMSYRQCLYGFPQMIFHVCWKMCLRQ